MDRGKAERNGAQRRRLGHGGQFLNGGAIRLFSAKSASLAVLVCLALAYTTGCGSLLSIVKTKPRPIPEKALATEKELEPIRKHAAYAHDMLSAVEETGVGAKNPAVANAESSAAVVETYVGSPAERLPIERDDQGKLVEAKGWADAMAAAQESIRLMRERGEAYESEVAALRARELGLQQKLEIKSGLVGRLTFWLIIAGGFLVLMPSIGGPVLLFLFRRFLTLKKTLSQVVSGVDGYLKSDAMEAEQLKASLDRSMDAKPKVEVDKLKREMGL